MGGSDTVSNEIITAVILAIVGGSGIVGLMFFFIRRYLENRLKENEDEEKRRREIHMRRVQIEDELHHAYGRLLFWIYRAIVTKTHNGELEAAFRELQAAEQKKKDLDREIIAGQGIE